MSTWISKALSILAVSGALGGCVAPGGTVRTGSAPVLGGALTVALPRSYCIDPKAGHEGPDSAVIIAGRCSAGDPVAAAAITISLRGSRLVRGAEIRRPCPVRLGPQQGRARGVLTQWQRRVGEDSPDAGVGRRFPDPAGGPPRGCLLAGGDRAEGAAGDDLRHPARGWDAVVGGWAADCGAGCSNHAAGERCVMTAKLPQGHPEWVGKLMLLRR